MRVLILSSWYPNAVNPAKGVFVREQARALAAQGLDVAVFYPFDEGIPVGEVNFSTEAGIATWRANSLALANRHLARLVSYRISLKLLDRVREAFRPDVLHVHVSYPTAIIAYLYTRKHKLPYVITEHMSYLQDYVAKWQHRLLLKQAFRKAALVMPVSTALARQIESFGWHIRLRPIPNVVDTERFGVEETADANPFGDPDPSTAAHAKRLLRILFVGGMEETEVKGLQFLLPAFEELVKTHPAHLELVGDGPWRRHYEALAARLGISEACHFHGAVAPERMPAYYQNADFLVLSSLKETFGCVLIEAMASGKPVLATACGGPESIVTPATGLLVQPGSLQALAAGLEQMAGEFARFDPLALRAYAEAHFGPRALARELREIYREATGTV